MDKIDIPCLKYIVDRVEEPTQLGGFRAFFCKVLSYDQILQTEQLSQEYICKVSAINGNLVDMFEFNGMSSDPSVFLSPDAVTPLSSSCSKYCEGILGEGVNICSICPRNSGVYLNEFEDEEYALLKFAVQSAENAAFLKNSIGSSQSIFKTMVDLAADIDSEHPILIDLNKYLYFEICGSSVFFNEEDVRERFMGKVLNHVFSKMSKGNKEITAFFSTREQVLKAVYSMVIDNILSAKDLSSGQVGELIDTIVKTRGKGRGKKKDKSTVQTDTLNFISSYKSPVITPEKKEIIDETAAGIIKEPPEHRGQSEKSAETGDTAEVTEQIESSEAPVMVYPELTQEPNIDKNLVIDDDRELPLYIPYVSKDFLLTLPDYEVYRESVLQEIVNMGEIVFECVRASDGIFILIHSSNNRTFVKVDYRKIDSALLGVFKSKSILKITWQVFLVYSLIKGYGVGCQNMYSIFSAFTLQNPNIRFGGYADIISRYIDLSGVGPITGELTGSKLAELYLICMPYYNRIRSAQMFYFETNPSAKRYYELYLEYLGISYLRGNNFKVKDHLFYIDVNCKVVFTEDPVQAPLHSGYLLSYAINSPEMGREQKERLFEYLMLEIANRGYMRKFNIQLSYMSADTLVLFCENYVFDAVKTFVRMVLDKYAVEHKTKSLTYVIDVRHVSPDQQEGTVTDVAYPASLRGAQDMLITPHDSVNVHKDRVRVKRKGGTKKQKETFPAKV